MNIHVQTAYRISKDSYRVENMQQYGTGKGNIVSIFMCQFGIHDIFFILEQKFKLQDVIDENGNILGSRLIIRFINNTDFFICHPNNTIKNTVNICDKYIKLYKATVEKQ